MRPDDRMDVLDCLPAESRNALVALLNGQEAEEVRALEQYPPDSAGGIMTTEVAAVGPVLTVEAAIAEVRRLNRELEHLHYVYVRDAQQRLLGVLSMRDLLLAESHWPVTQVMRPEVISVSAFTDQEQVARLIRKHDYVALPVVDEQQRLVGLVTIDDLVDVLEEEATEDIQKMGGAEALDAPYFSVGLATLLRKRGGWLSILFFGEMLTATAMGFFEGQIAKAIVLVLFIPLIISSGGNAGSQAATLIIRSLALGELRLRDWPRVLVREFSSGLTLGAWLGGIGFVRVVAWHHAGWVDYGPHYWLVGMTIWLSLTGVVLFGTIAGAMLPLLIRRLGADPATSSAPFVATLVDVTGLVIYFSVGMLLLKNVMF